MKTLVIDTLESLEKALDGARNLIFNGNIFIIAGAEYKGRHPEYKNISAAGTPAKFVKVKSGLPFVRSKS